MLMVFELSMPHVGSWNGKWTGEDNYYAKVFNFKQRYGTSKNARELFDKILSNGSYCYSFGDGWGMSISVRQIDSKEATKLRKKTKGFCGYDWAIESILQHQKITTK
ncbi:hypothetical protein SAMN05446037_100653 [Anaerovirgula multivorans]|uniref:Uncharacterized protein n=1 Tax=Anaerovirgula multivorans TaxID=312168 RepID=A0A239CNW5_9FIRM|nr:hypothetical protein [Anaerovirgula multivorans]SNS21371.1 hypothetical protein SAMN05446037_100653 [Anaerovirgula multivorans]